MKQRLLELNGISSMKKQDKTEELNQQLEAVTAKLNALLEYQGLNVELIGGGTYKVIKETEKPSGEYTNPIQWKEGDAVMVDLYYYYDDYDLRKAALLSGVPTSWLDADYFDQF